MALRNPNKPHIKMSDGIWFPEYTKETKDPVVMRRNIDAWAFCINRFTGQQMVKALEARGICFKR